MANSAGITKGRRNVPLEAFTGAVTTSLKKGKRVTLVNFGTFTISSGKAGMGRNRGPGKPSNPTQPAFRSFQPGKNLKRCSQ